MCVNKVYSITTARFVQFKYKYWKYLNSVGGICHKLWSVTSSVIEQKVDEVDIWPLTCDPAACKREVR